MNRIARSILSSLFLFGALSSQAQTFQNSDVRLGDIVWKEPARVDFRFTNTSSSPLRITDVQTDCGCTLATWSSAPIAPNQTVTISVTYNAQTLGTFSKHVFVYTDAREEGYTLRLSGRVLTEIFNENNDYPFQIGDIRLSTDNIEFDDVNRGEQPEKLIYVYNGSRKNYIPELMHLPKYLSYSTHPEVLRPGKRGTIRLHLNSSEIHSMGLTQTSIYLSRFPGDKVSKSTEIGVSATLLPHMAYSSAQRLNAPVAVVDTLIDLGSFSNKKKINGEILLTNKGRSPLKISTLQVYNPGISVSLSKSTIKPGQSAKLKISASSGFEFLRGSHRILLITNDPNRQKITIDVMMKK